MSAQLAITLCACALVPFGFAASVLDPWSPCCCGVSVKVLIRSVFAGVQVSESGLQTLLFGQTVASVATVHAVLGGAPPTLDTIAPTPPEMPRTLPSKSEISSFTAVQLRTR